ncbi:MAG: hypothetical protein E6G88_09060 [Alphaproteobacteria bacterium]|nr:MAG: hypothetical protein E6G88_09060 [Alphaproteobacteria bacterium]
MKILAILPVTLVLAATSVTAQVNVAAPQGGASNVVPAMRVTTTFRATVVAVETQTILDPKPQETARRTLYGMAEGECAALSEVFKSECRLSSLSIVNPVITNMLSSPNLASAIMTATAVYELTPRGH